MADGASVRFLCIFCEYFFRTNPSVDNGKSSNVTHVIPFACILNESFEFCELYLMQWKVINSKPFRLFNEYEITQK